MKFDIFRSDQGVEIHLHNDDGSRTVWLCDDVQVAFYKLASLLFSQPEPAKNARRSILIGDFAAEAPKPAEKTLAERGEEVKKRLSKDGLAPKGAIQSKDAETKIEPAISPDIQKALEEMLKGINDGTYKKYPTQPLQPYGPMPTYPYIGDPVPWPGSYTSDGTGLIGKFSGGGSIVGDIQVDVYHGPNGSGFASSAQLADSQVGQLTMSNGSQMNIFKCSMKAAG